MPKLFISYRRADSAYVTDSIYDYMVRHFGKDNVFLDVGSIPFGVDFREYLRDQIAGHDVILVIIGPEWARLMQNRMSQGNDFVRIEIENALIQNKFVVPVLVMNAEMPDFSMLPPSIQELQWRNSALVRRQPDLEHDCNRLAEGIKSYLAQPMPSNVAPISRATMPGEMIEASRRHSKSISQSNGHVFISYTRADKDFAGRLVSDLEQQGVVCWLDYRDLVGSLDWEESIRDAIRNADAVLLIASKNSRLSYYVRDELTMIEAYKGRGWGMMIPAWIEGDTWIDSIPMGWGQTRMVDARGDNYPNALKEILHRLQTAASHNRD